VTAPPLAPETDETVRAMLEARSIALVGASARAGSLGERMIREVGRSASRPRTYLVNPRYSDIGGAPCLPSLADLPEPVDLAILAVPDAALEEQLAAAARANARSAIIFGSAFDAPGSAGPPGSGQLRDRLAATAKDAGMALCGAGCMGFVNLARGLFAVGYLLPEPVPAGPVALITHSGSVFTAMLNARRGFGFTLAVSPGQELVTGAPAYARYALSLPETRVLALVLEAIRNGTELREVLAAALAADVPVVLLSVGGSPAGKALVNAHSGALAAADGAWEALAGAYGVHRVRDLAELADTLELFAPGRRCAPGGGIATVHDSGLERAHLADLAAELGVPFAAIGAQTTERLAAALDPGLDPANPLDLWGTGKDIEPLVAECLSALAADPAVAAVALAVDLAPEWDGDEAYPRALITTAAGTDKPVAVLAGLPATVDPVAAAALRAAGVPVLEGTRSGLVALRHLLDHADRPQPPDAKNPEPPDPERRQRWARVLSAGPPDSATLFDLLRDYGIPAVRVRPAATRTEVLDAAAEIGYPAVLKTDEPHIAHKSDVGGVCLGLGDLQAVVDAYEDLSDLLGPRVLVCETAAPGPEVALGLTRDPALGPLLVIGAGGLLVEILAERAVVLPPVTPAEARKVLARLRLARILAGARGQPAADLDAIAAAITGLSALACELGDVLEALDINPLICGPNGAVAADVLAVPRLGPAPRYDLRHGSREKAVSGPGSVVRRRHHPGGRLQQFGVVVAQQHERPARHLDPLVFCDQPGQCGGVHQHRRAVRPRPPGDDQARPGQLRQPVDDTGHGTVLRYQDREHRRPDRRRAAGQVRRRDRGREGHDPGPGPGLAERARAGLHRGLQHRRDPRPGRDRVLPAGREHLSPVGREGNYPAGGQP
jgi:acyl-CoA synthetase (NDP forming)